MIRSTDGKRRKLNNKGFSVITVIIAIAFIGIMAMLVLYISMSNFQMKVTDLKAKDSFYTAENAMDEIRAGLQQEVSEAMSDAYVEVLESYTDESTSNVESLEQVRQAAFQKKYIEKLKKRLALKENDRQYDMSIIRGFVDMLDPVTGINWLEESLKIVNPQGKYPDLIEDTEDTGIILKNLKVIYVDTKGRASIIETDIRLGMPRVTFPTPSTLPDLMNMIVVANKGMILGSSDSMGENSGEISIKGSVYAGQEMDGGGNVLNKNSLVIKPGQKVSLGSGERFVCLGEINVGNGASFSNNSGADLWARGLSVTSGTVKLTGKTYFADDLTLNTMANSSMGSTISISGEYYGYGSPSSAKNSYFGNNKYSNSTDTALSSSIIINGKGSTLDLAGVTKLMLAGNSYVGSRAVQAGDDKVGNHTNSSDVMMGESLTVKGNQIAYLVPSDCFVDEGYTNPMSFDTYAVIPEADVSQLFDMNKKIDAWGKKSMNELGLNSAEPVQKVFYSAVGGGYVYFYLNFASSSKASDYFYNYYNNSEIKANIDKYLNFYLGNDQGIFMRDKTAFLRFVTKGNVLTYNGGDGQNGQGNLNKATDPNPTETQLREQTNYQNMWYALTRKMITSYDLLKDNVKKDGVLDHDERASDRYVFQNLVDEDGMKEFLASQSTNEYKFSTVSAGDTLEAYIVDNETTGSFIIDSAKAKNTRLVVATGDVVIEEGVAFYGIIMTKGKLNMKSGSSLSSAPLEAAKVFQAQRQNAEEKIPMDFFWEGDKYILGNSLADNDGTGDEAEKDVYDIAQCITYQNWTKK